MKTAPRARSEARRRPAAPAAPAWLPALGLLLLVFLAYLPVTPAGFIWDDDQHVESNPALRSADGLVRIWTDPTATPQYYPLVHTLFWIEYHLWGVQPLGYHLVNVLLHATAAILLWRVLVRLDVPFALVAALVFALHPVHVESVAWITERKNVLSACFYLASALAFLKFRWPAPEQSPRKSRWLYAFSLLLFVAALLSKTVTCSLPAALLLVVWWKEGRLRARDWLAVLPMFVLGLAAAALTVYLEKYHVGAIGAEWNLTPAQRLLVASRAIVFYATKLVWPLDLTFVYPRWTIDSASWWQYLFPLAVVGVTVGLAMMVRRWGRGPLVAWCFFVGTLVPALGLFDVYPMRYSFVADHFQYLASIGMIVGLLAAARRWLPQSWRGPASVLMIAVLVVLAWRRADAFRDARTLWEDTLRKNPDCWLAEHSLANLALKRGEPQRAVQLYVASLRHHEDDVEAHTNLALLLVQSGPPSTAETHLRRALELDPNWAPAHNNLGMLLMSLGRSDEAEAEFKQTLAIDAGHRSSGDRARAHFSLGTLYLQRQDLDAAERELRAALHQSPDMGDAHNNLGTVLRTRGDLDGAIAEYRAALEADPQNEAARQNLKSAIAERDRR